MCCPNATDLSHLALENDDLPTVVALDLDLIAHCQCIINEDFPRFNNVVGQVQVTLGSQGIQALTQEVHLGWIENRQERDHTQNKTFQLEYPASFHCLLGYAQVQNCNFLHPVWNQLAFAKKGDCIRVLG